MDYFKDYLDLINSYDFESYEFLIPFTTISVTVFSIIFYSLLRRNNKNINEEIIATYFDNIQDVIERRYDDIEEHFNDIEDRFDDMDENLDKVKNEIIGYPVQNYIEHELHMRPQVEEVQQITDRSRENVVTPEP